MYIRALMLEIVLLLSATAGERLPQDDAELGARVIRYLNNNIDKELSLDKLAKKFFVSKYHIAHVFKENIGLSIHQYITKKRLDLCQEAISGGMSITDAYHHYGFGDYSSFYRAFKKEYGISPKDYRDMQIDLGSENAYTE